MLLQLVSLPVRGAWIEIPTIVEAIFVIWSLPVRGAWIEIVVIQSKKDPTIVAPRKGSVD